MGEYVELCVVGQPLSSFHGRITHVARAGSHVIDEPTLTHVGGGAIPVNPNSMEASQAYFEVIIEIADVPERSGSGDNITDSSIRHGMTAFVRFKREPISIAKILYRRGLQLLGQLRTSG